MALTLSLPQLVACAALTLALSGIARANDFYSTWAPEPTALMPGFGRSVALGAQLVVVGAPGAIFDGEIQGAADVFDRESAQHLSQLRAPLPLDGDRFGSSVAVDGHLVLVGDPERDSFTGGAYLFDGLTGSLVAELDPGSLSSSDLFGSSLALSGGKAYVGAPGAAGGGAVDIFDLGSGLHTRLAGPPGSYRFGWKVVVQGDDLIVGSAEQPIGNMAPGRVSVFDVQTLVQRLEFSSPDAQVGERFADSLAASNGVLAVGAPERSEGVAKAGAVYLFDLASGAFLRKIKQQMPAYLARFGRQIAINSRVLMVDAVPQFGTDGIYSFDVQSGLELARIPRPNDNLSTSFGEALAMDEEAVLAGEWYYFETTGRAHLLPIMEVQGVQECGPALANSSGGPATIRAVGTLQAHSGCFALLASEMPALTAGYFLNARSGGISLPAGSSGRLCLSGGIGRYNQDVLSTGAAGTFRLDLDLASTPVPAGFEAVLPGETWRFQAWFRDVDSSGTTSNFTDAVAVTFE